MRWFVSGCVPAKISALGPRWFVRPSGFRCNSLDLDLLDFDLLIYYQFGKEKNKHLSGLKKKKKRIKVSLEHKGLNRPIKKRNWAEIGLA